MKDETIKILKNTIIQWKKEYEILDSIIEIKDAKIKQLKAENEQLKALCDTYRTCYQAKHSDIKCLFIKYKQTLQKIKEILIFNKRELEECLCNNISGEIIDLITKAESEIKNDAKEPKTYNDYLKDEMQNKYYKGK